MRDKGWLPGGKLEVGDQLLSHDGQWVAVTDRLDTGEIETVYNLRVSEYHTYFVGTREWGFSLWAHNSYSDGGAAWVANQAARDASFVQGATELIDQLQQIDPRTGGPYISPRRTIGVGELHLGDQTQLPVRWATTGENPKAAGTLPAPQAVFFASQQPMLSLSNQVFVPNTGRPGYNGGENHPDAKLAEWAAQQLLAGRSARDANGNLNSYPDITGEYRLLIGHPDAGNLCPGSCVGTYEQFQFLFPNVNLFLFNRDGAPLANPAQVSPGPAK